MAIAYSSGPNRNDLYAGVITSASAMSDIRTSLVASNWTVTALNAFNVLSLDSSQNAGNTETVTIDSKVYTFKTVINNANNGDVLIGADSPASLTNLKAAINLGTGSGTLYSSATTLNTNLRGGLLIANSPGNPYLVVEQKTAGVPAPYTVSETLSFGSWGSNTVNWVGYKAKSALSPSGLDSTYYFYDAKDGNCIVRNIAMNSSETSASGSLQSGQILFNNPPGATDIRVMCCPYHAFVSVNGAAGVSTTNFWGVGTIWIPTFLEGVVVSGATNVSPIVITTSTAHGRTTGDAVTIRGVLGNTAANVTNNACTVLTTTTLSLDATTGNGAYTSGGRLTKIGVDIVEAVWCTGTSAGGNLFRSTANQTNTNWTILNGSLTTNSGSSNGGIMLAVVTATNAINAELAWFNGFDLVSEPFVCFGTSNSAVATINGQFFDMVYVRKAQTKDVTGTFDAHNWWNLTDNYSNAISGGSFLHVVP